MAHNTTFITSKLFILSENWFNGMIFTSVLLMWRWIFIELLTVILKIISFHNDKLYCSQVQQTSIYVVVVAPFQWKTQAIIFIFMVLFVMLRKCFIFEKVWNYLLQSIGDNDGKYQFHLLIEPISNSQRTKSLQCLQRAIA